MRRRIPFYVCIYLFCYFESHDENKRDDITSKSSKRAKTAKKKTEQDLPALASSV